MDNYEIIEKVFYSITETFLALGFGALLFKKNYISAGEMSRLSTLSLDVFFPILTFSTIVKSFSVDNWQEAVLMPVLGFVLMALGALLGYMLLWGLRNSSTARQRTFHHLCAINNYVLLPLIVVGNLWGERHVALLLLMNVGSTIGFWTIGIITFTGIEEGLKKWRNILSWNIYAVLLAVGWVLTGWKMPLVLTETTTLLGCLAVPFMLILSGAALMQTVNGLLKNPFDAIYFAVIRLFLLPLVIIMLLKLLPLPPEVYQVVFVVALMPAAVSSVLVAREYGGSAEFTGQAIMITTFLSLLTIPLMIAWLL